MMEWKREGRIVGGEEDRDSSIPYMEEHDVIFHFL